MIPVKYAADSDVEYIPPSEIELKIHVLHANGTYSSALLDESTHPSVRFAILTNDEMEFTHDTIDQVFKQGWIDLNGYIAETQLVSSLTVNTIMSALETPAFATSVAEGIACTLGRSYCSVNDALNVDCIKLAETLNNKGLLNLDIDVLLATVPPFGPHAGKIFGCIDPGDAIANKITDKAIARLDNANNSLVDKRFNTWLTHYAHLMSAAKRHKLLPDHRFSSGLYSNINLPYEELRLTIEFALDGNDAPLQAYLNRNSACHPGGLDARLVTEMLSERCLEGLWDVSPRLTGLLNRLLPGHPVLGEVSEDDVCRAFVSWSREAQIKLIGNPAANVSMGLLNYAASGYDLLSMKAQQRLASMQPGAPAQPDSRSSNTVVHEQFKEACTELYFEAAPAMASRGCKADLTSARSMQDLDFKSPLNLPKRY